ncbi:hypothetical protein [Aureimonas sp. AU40]|uniref:hypothetical protein n=1 Tax=Aureimonas sp. AU40 TaxID=1637747 RepID=UPI00078557CB|nr:hypothetical protein [Aureimonas sp. AU40]
MKPIDSFKTLSDQNQFTFTCPIFDATTRMVSCMNLRELVWSGRRPEKRQGCQAALCAGKCPINNIIKRLGVGDYGDPYGSFEPKHGSLRREDLQRIRPVICDERDMKKYEVSARERELIATANDRIDAAMKSAPRTKGAIHIEHDEMPAPRRKPSAPKAAAPAKAGPVAGNDLTTAINNAVKEAA